MLFCLIIDCYVNSNIIGMQAEAFKSHAIQLFGL